MNHSPIIGDLLMCAFITCLSMCVTGGYEDLADSEYATREQESRRLASYGLLALPTVWAAAGSTDPEVRWRGRAAADSILRPRRRQLNRLLAARLLLSTGPAFLSREQAEQVREACPELCDGLEDVGGALFCGVTCGRENRDDAVGFVCVLRHWLRGQDCGPWKLQKCTLFQE